jgi:hypothetical protein
MLPLLRLAASVSGNFWNMLRHYLLILILLNISYTYSQKCEDYDKSLFHLRFEPPDKINCKDSMGYKQGFWIYYIVKHNPIIPPNEFMPSGDYVDEFYSGYYCDNKKIGIWKTTNNFHLIYDKDFEEYYYGKDTILVTYDDWPRGKIITYFNSDSTIMNAECISIDGIDTTYIYCDKRSNPLDSNCTMIYKNRRITTFSTEVFEIEVEKCNTTFYLREKRKIKENYR